MLDGLPGPVPMEHIVFISDNGRNADVICASLAQFGGGAHFGTGGMFFGESVTSWAAVPLRKRDSKRTLLWVLHTCMEGYMNIHGYMCGEGRG